MRSYALVQVNYLKLLSMSGHDVVSSAVSDLATTVTKRKGLRANNAQSISAAIRTTDVATGFNSE